MNGVLVVDKPQGLTSHDVVAAARRMLGERRIGHTGTLDPLATGVLPLTIGRATRLVRFLAASDKEYEATIRFGLTTNSYDITGMETSRTEALPSREALVTALAALTGEYRQIPPMYSAKKVHGRRAYALARDAGSDSRLWRGAQTPLPDCLVRMDRVDLLEFGGDRARVALTCSAGFYVRSFAHDLGQRVGTGACLEALRRTRAGDFTLAEAIPLEELHDQGRVAERLVPLNALLGSWPAVTLTDRGRDHVAHGRTLDEDDCIAAGPRHPPNAIPDSRRPDPVDPAWIRLLDGRGELVAMATPGAEAGSLHPAIVLI